MNYYCFELYLCAHGRFTCKCDQFSHQKGGKNEVCLIENCHQHSRVDTRTSSLDFFFSFRCNQRDCCCCKRQPLKTEAYFFFCRQDVFHVGPFRRMLSVLWRQVEENLAASFPKVAGARRCRCVLIWTQRDLNVSPLPPPCPVRRLGSDTVAATVLMIIVASPRALHMLRWFLVQRRFLHRSGTKKNLLALSFARSELPAVGKNKPLLNKGCCGGGGGGV